METRLVTVDPHHPDEQAIAEAAAVIRSGGLVAFPTETVYGLGADALNPSAVQGIFRAKGRPGDNPLIVHLADPGELPAVGVPLPRVEPLARRFWPGPLTLVLPGEPAGPGGGAAGVKTGGGSYTHLTLPTSNSVEGSVGAGAFKKKNEEM